MLPLALVAGTLCVLVGSALVWQVRAAARVRASDRARSDDAMVTDCLANAGVLIDLTDAALRERLASPTPARRRPIAADRTATAGSFSW